MKGAGGHGWERDGYGTGIGGGGGGGLKGAFVHDGGGGWGARG